MKMEVSENKIYECDLKRKVLVTHVVRYYVIDFLAYGAVFWIGLTHRKLYWLVPPFIVLVVKDAVMEWVEKRMFTDLFDTLKDDKTELVLNDVKLLPAWVKCPDVERSIWLNNLLIYLWPHISISASEAFDSKVKPLIKKEVPGFKIRTFSLGTIPPFVNGIKVFDKDIDCRELIADVNYSYCGDCEFSVSYFFIPAGVKNVQVVGNARLYLHLLPAQPIVGGIDISLLDKPSIDFMLTGVGCIGPAEAVVERVLDHLISTFLVYPQKVSLTWEDLSKDGVPDLECLVRINVKEAKLDGDFDEWRASETHAEVTFGNFTFHTEKIRNSDKPDWDYWCEVVPLSKQYEPITISVFYLEENSNLTKSGNYLLNINELEKSKKIDSWFQLEGNLPGSVHVIASFIPLVTDKQLLKVPPDNLAFLSSYVFMVYIKSAHKLAIPRTFQRPNSFVTLSVGKTTYKTRTILSDSPNFKETFVFLLGDPEFFYLNINVSNDKGLSLGSLSFSLWKLFNYKNMEIVEEKFPLIDSAKNSSIDLTLKLKIVKNEF